MPTSLQALLPAPEESPRCADHARSIAVDPGGTAIRADRIVLVATPLPWPKPALDHPLLADLRPLFDASDVPTRLLATIGRDDARGIDVTVFDRDGGSAVERRYRVDSAASLLELGSSLAASAAPGVGIEPFEPSGPARPTVLICTQGSHDVCCGSEGARFALEVEAEMDLEVHRVSHTGGHRFAPTAMTLPDGRMWADLDLDALRRVMAGVGQIDDLIERCRGWWGAETGAAQVAERAVFAERGWELEGEDRTVAEAVSDESGGGGARRYSVSSDSAAYDVEVAEGRVVPTIACRSPGGLPAKEGREYEVRSVSRTR